MLLLMLLLFSVARRGRGWNKLDVCCARTGKSVRFLVRMSTFMH